MSNIKVRLQYDPTGRNADNLVGSEAHDLKAVAGFPYKIITLDNGGFYTRSLRVYDSAYNKLSPGVDYIYTYRHAVLSQELGLNICSAIVFLDPTRVGTVYCSAQMVGGDAAFSLTVITDYVIWFNSQPVGYVPRNDDFNGNEPQWKPGELDIERWHLDTYQPFNNEIYDMARSINGATGPYEQDFRDHVLADYNAFLLLFNDRLQRHIDDKGNPHVDVKDDVGLGLVENYTVASEQIARAGQSNTTYLTPALSWAVVDEFAIKPMNNHINLRPANPHRTTPETIDSPVKTVVDAKANTKYLRNEQVVNADYFANSANPDPSSEAYTYYDYYQYARSKIAALEFLAQNGGGFINPYRIGRGSPAGNTALNGDGLWVTWDSIIVQQAPPPSPVVMICGAFGDRNVGHNFVITQPWARTVPVGSVAFYYLDTLYWWGSGNGAIQLGGRTTCGSFKTASGWIMI